MMPLTEILIGSASTVAGGAFVGTIKYAVKRLREDSEEKEYKEIINNNQEKMCQAINENSNKRIKLENKVDNMIEQININVQWLIEDRKNIYYRFDKIDEKFDKIDEKLNIICEYLLKK